MSLYSEWDKIAYQIDTQEEYDRFWGEYLPLEAEFYKSILGDYKNVVKKSVMDLAEQFNVEVLTTVGFLDGINSSLKNELDIENIDENTVVELDVDYKKLFFNMHDAKAEWLYQLQEWDNILTEDEKKTIKKEYNQSKIYVNENKIGRNDDCPCGSGKKYKKCCGKSA